MSLHRNRDLLTASHSHSAGSPSADPWHEDTAENTTVFPQDSLFAAHPAQGTALGEDLGAAPTFLHAGM